MSALEAKARDTLERNVIALGEAVRQPEAVACRVLAQLDDQELEKLRQKLLSAFKALDFE